MSTVRYRYSYPLGGVTPEGNAVDREDLIDGAPTKYDLVEWGLEQGCSWVIRYYPTLEGFFATDIRNAKIIRRLHDNEVVEQVARAYMLDRKFSTMAEAQMWLIHHRGSRDE